MLPLAKDHLTALLRERHRAVLVSGGFALVVSLVFGFYPAHRAARLDPIEALRSS